jgi:mono/diheme cytochrome c family protein
VIRGFVNGIVFTVALALGAAYVALRVGVLPSGADVRASRLERWAANTSLHATIDRETKGLTDPLQPTDGNLTDGAHLYAQNCAICHGAADAMPSNPAKGLYIRAPQLAKDGVEDDDESETYWKIEHGIRFTAMPAFGKTLSDEDAWKLAMFLKRMDKLPAAVEAEWKKVPSVAPSPAPTGAK